LPIGLRGVGKTVLLNRFSEIAEQEGIEVGFIEAPEGEDFKSLLANRLRKILLALDGGGSLSEDSKGTSGVEEFSDALRATATGVRPTAADEGLTEDSERCGVAHRYLLGGVTVAAMDGPRPRVIRAH
jgi:GTPase SAR1 family protein